MNYEILRWNQGQDTIYIVLSLPSGRRLVVRVDDTPGNLNSSCDSQGIIELTKEGKQFAVICPRCYGNDDASIARRMKILDQVKHRLQNEQPGTIVTDTAEETFSFLKAEGILSVWGGRFRLKI